MRISLSTHALIALVMALALIVAAPMVFAEEGTGSTDDSTTTASAGNGESVDSDEVNDDKGTTNTLTKEQRMQKLIEAYRARVAQNIGKKEGMMEQKQVKFTGAMDALRAKMEARIAAMRTGKGMAPTTPVKSITAEQAVCIAPLVADREEALADAFDVYSTAIATALDTRADALADAWALTDATARAAAVKAAWDAHKVASKSAHDAMRTARNAAHKAFRDEVKTDCKADVPADEAPVVPASDTIAL